MAGENTSTVETPSEAVDPTAGPQRAPVEPETESVRASSAMHPLIIEPSVSDSDSNPTPLGRSAPSLVEGGSSPSRFGEASPNDETVVERRPMKPTAPRQVSSTKLAPIPSPLKPAGKVAFKPAKTKPSPIASANPTSNSGSNPAANPAPNAVPDAADVESTADTRVMPAQRPAPRPLPPKVAPPKVAPPLRASVDEDTRREPPRRDDSRDGSIKEASPAPLPPSPNRPARSPSTSVKAVPKPATDAAADKAADRSDEAMSIAGSTRTGSAAAAESAARLMIEQSPGFVFRLSPNGRITHASSGLAELLGRSTPRDLMGVSLPEAVFEDPADYVRLCGRLDGTGAPMDALTRWKRADGTRLSVRVRLRRQSSPDGQTRAFDGSAEDVSEAMLREDQLRHDLELMRELARKRLADLQDVQKRFGSIPSDWVAASHRINDELNRLFGTLDTARGQIGELLVSLSQHPGERQSDPDLETVAVTARSARAAPVAEPSTVSLPAVSAPAAAAAARPAEPPIARVDLDIGPDGSRSGSGALPLVLLSDSTAAGDSASALQVIELEPGIPAGKQDVGKADRIAEPVRDGTPSRSGPTLPNLSSAAQTGWQDVNALVEKALPDIRDRVMTDARSRNIEIRIRTRLKATTPIRANPGEIREVLGSLILASVRAMKASGVVVITTATVAKGTLVAVTDNRSTIPDDFKDRMFDAAYQAVDDRVRVLRACRQSMSRHGGKVGVLSEAGLGTTVTMRFPRPKAIE